MEGMMNFLEEYVEVNEVMDAMTNKPEIFTDYVEWNYGSHECSRCGEMLKESDLIQIGFDRVCDYCHDEYLDNLEEG